MITICKNKKIVSYMLHAYYLLPMLILSCLAFNTEDGKHYISRLVVAMFIISLFTARKILWSNLNNPEIKRIMFFLDPNCSCFCWLPYFSWRGI